MEHQTEASGKIAHNQRMIAYCDQWIEEILAEQNQELEAFVCDNNPRYPHVKALVDFERARRLALIRQLELPHAACEQVNVEKVTTWFWAGLIILGLLAGAGIVQAVRWLF